MTKKIAVIEEFCDSCPYFDNEYYSYNHHCEKLGRKIELVSTNKGYDGYLIPEDCPLPDATDEIILLTD